MPPPIKVDPAVANLIEKKFSEMNKNFSDLNAKFSEMKTEMLEIINARNEEIVHLKSSVEKLKSDNLTLQNTLTRLENTMDEGDAYERRDTLIISGNSVPKVEPGEICSSVVKSLVEDKLKVKINPSDISTAHRLGQKKPNQEEDRRSLIIKFCRRDVKRDVLTASRKLRAPQMFVNESLTPTRLNILKTLRQIKREHPDVINGCTSLDGKIFAYTPRVGGSSGPQRDLRHLVNTQSALQEFCRVHIKRPLDAFLESLSRES